MNVGTNGARFVGRAGNDNQWNKLRNDFGTAGNVAGPINGNPGKTNNVLTIVANLDGETLTPVDKAYLYSQNLRILDMVRNAIPGQNNNSASWGKPYETDYQNIVNANAPAYNVAGDRGTVAGSARTDGDFNGSYEVRGMSNTTYYVVYNAHGTDPMTTGQNVVVREYKGYGSVPSSVTESGAIEDVYVVGARQNAASSNPDGVTYYAAQVVVIEMGSSFKAASEQVFIPEFSQLVSADSIEDVTMIRGGEKVTVKVDMTNSNTSDFYNIAGNVTGGTRRTRLPGLYFMDPSDTNADVYVIERMSPADIANADYAVGYIRESDGMDYNYPQVELLYRPTDTAYTNVDGNGNYLWIDNFGNGSATDIVTASGLTGLVTAQKTIPVSVGATDWYGRAVRESTKVYTYDGTANGLVLSDTFNVLGKTHHNVGTTNQSVNGLNERWDGLGADVNGNYLFPNTNRNEVLVHYDGNTIVWAISFNETSNLYAQKVWWNCLPTQGASSDSSAPAMPGKVDLVAKNPVVRAAHPDMTTVRENLTPGINNINWNTWNPIRTRDAYLEITPAPGTTCFVNGVQMSVDSWGVILYPLNNTIGDFSGDQQEVVNITVQKGGRSATYTYTISYQNEASAPGGVYSKNLAKVKFDDGSNPTTISLADSGTKIRYSEFKTLIGAQNEPTDSVEVYASNKGSELLDDVYMNHADYIKLTVKNGDKVTVYEFNGNAIDDGIDSGYFNITTTGDVKITSSGKDVVVVKNGDTLTFSVKSDVGGSFKLEAADGTVNTVSGTFNAGTVTGNWTASSVDADITVTFVPVTETTYKINLTGTGSETVVVTAPESGVVDKGMALPSTVGLDFADDTVTDKIILVKSVSVNGINRTFTTTYGGTYDVAIGLSNAYNMEGDMTIEIEVKDVDAYVDETAGQIPDTDPDRAQWTEAYRRANITIGSAKNSDGTTNVNVSLSKSNFETFVKKAENKSDVQVLSSTDALIADKTTLYAGILFNAPVNAKSVRYQINGSLTDTSPVAPKNGSTPGVAGSDKFLDDGVHFYVALGNVSVDLQNITGFTFNTSANSTVELQFYTDESATAGNEIGSVQRYVLAKNFAD